MPRVNRALPVILVHGFGVSSSYFVPTARRLGREFSVYAPDLPGHGKSATPLRTLDIPELAGALVAWMDAVGLDRVMLIGNSMGCQIIADTALHHPDRVDRLVLIGPVVDPAARTPMRLINRVIRDVVYERVFLGVIVLVDYARMGHRLFQEYRHMLRYPLQEVLPKIEVPCMLVRGEHDPVASQMWLEEAARLLATSSLITIPNGGHAVHYSTPDQFVESIAPFLHAS
ncbi:MAG: alpha/beta hydrolase [Pirellulales bacterium]